MKYLITILTTCFVFGYVGNSHASNCSGGRGCIDNHDHIIVGNDDMAFVKDYGTAISGNYGYSVAGNWGKAITGNYGTAIARYKGIAISGYKGISSAGYDGIASTGKYGQIQIQYFDGIRDRTLIGYIGENGLKPNVKYKVEGGKFVAIKE